MSADRYMRIVLTVIALELGWIAMKDDAVPVSAQQAEPRPMPVIIRGVETTPGKPGPLPVSLVGSTATVRIAADRALPVEVPQPLAVHADGPVTVETAPERPLLIQSVPGAPAARPGL
jgi:hypothetical protein